MPAFVDPSRCRGIGLCEAYAPSVFAVGDDGQAHVLSDDIADADLFGAEEAVANCPTNALSIRS